AAGEGGLRRRDRRPVLRTVPRAGRSGLALGEHVGQEHPRALELLPKRTAAVRLEEALDLLPGGRGPSVFADRHRRQMSSWVTLSPSASVVSPARTLRAPSSRRVSIPFDTPERLMEVESTFFSVS